LKKKYQAYVRLKSDDEWWWARDIYFRDCYLE
jgi:hypothetical protein